MKKVMMVAAVAALGMASCTKDRTCTCTSTYAGTSSTYTKTIMKSTKGQAKANCVSTSETDNGVTQTEDCKLS